MRYIYIQFILYIKNLNLKAEVHQHYEALYSTSFDVWYTKQEVILNAYLGKYVLTEMESNHVIMF